MAKDKLKGHAATTCAYIIFGLNIVFCKDIANSAVITPIALFSLRAAGASALFWIISLFLPAQKVDRSDFPKIAVASCLGLFITQYTFLCAIKMTTAIDTSIMSTFSPIFTMFIAAIVLKEPITAKKAGGVALSFAGILYLIFNTAVSSNGVEKTNPWGIVLLMINCLSFAAYLGIFRPLIQKYTVITFMKWMFLASLLISLPFSFSDLMTTEFSDIPLKTGLEIGYLIIFATFIAYFLIPVGQKYLRPTLVSMYSYLQPTIATIIAIVIGMDTLTWQKIVATALIVCGVIIVNKSRAANS